MNCCRDNCGYLAVILGILAGVAVGVLYALGFIATGILLWAYLAIGVTGIIMSPIYATRVSCKGNCQCYTLYRRLIKTAAIGTVVTAALGLIVAAVATTVVVSIAVALATLFATLLLGALVCLADCLSQN